MHKIGSRGRFTILLQGQNGRLGHGSTDSELLPKAAELESRMFRQLALYSMVQVSGL